MKIKNKCPSCGKLWIDHPGIILTCKELQKLKSVLHKIVDDFELQSSIEEAGCDVYQDLLKLLSRKEKTCK